MKKLVYSITILLPAVFLISCSSSNLKVQGIKYRTNGAIRAEMLQAGSRNRAGGNSFTPYTSLISGSTLKAKVLTQMSIDDVKGLKAKLSAAGIPGINQPGIDLETGNGTSGTFVILGLNDKKAVLKALQSSDNAETVEYLSQLKEPRIITTIATTLSYSKAKNVSVKTGATGDLSLIGAGAGSLTLEVGGTGKKTVKFSDGTIFAYELSIPAWKRGSDGKLYIADYIEDRLGIRHTNPISGSYLDPTKVP